MKFADVDALIGDLPATTREHGQLLFDFIIQHNLSQILEIGFHHGKSANYMAAALDELGSGLITTIDIEMAKKYRPNILELSEKTELSRYINPIFSPSGSSWELRDIIIKQTTFSNKCNPIFDLCFVDGYHSWDYAALDFFLSEKLLNPGGWIIFDDITWSFEKSPTWRNLDQTKRMPENFRIAQQVGDVYRYLVCQHPNFGNFHDDGFWGWAQKRPIA